MTGKVKHMEGNIVLIQSGDKIIPVFAVYNDGSQYYPIVAGYALTVHKVMGQTLLHVTLVFDMQILSQGVGYVALSRVSSLDNVVPVLRLRRSNLPCFIAGAVEAGRKFKCSPIQALDCTEFTYGYWEWCHLFLIDVVRQCGYQSLFITISPSEWSFPKVEAISMFHLCLF